MLPKRQRIARSTEIQAVIRKGFAVRTPTVTGHILVVGGSGLRCGYIAGKRVGNAVTRNYAKRRFRELTKYLFSAVPDGRAIEVVWRLHPASATATIAAMEKDIAKVWRKAVEKCR